MSEDASKPEKWPFSETQPVREDQVKNAVNFLSHPKVRGTPMVQRFSFLERKGLSREEIEEAFRRCPDPPSSDVSPKGKVPPLLTQASGPLSSIGPARSKSYWSQLILGAGIIAAAGAGTGYLVQKVLAPKLRAWLRDVILEEKKPTGSKREGKEEGLKLTPLEEAVGAAAVEATNAAAAAEVFSSSDLQKLQAEDWQHLRSLIKTLESKTEDLKGTLTLMSKNSQDAEEHMVSIAHVKGSSSYKGAEHTQMKQAVQSVNGVDKTQSYGQPANVSSFLSQSEDKPWWYHKKVDVETHAALKQSMEGALQTSDVEADFDL